MESGSSRKKPTPRRNTRAKRDGGSAGPDVQFDTKGRSIQVCDTRIINSEQRAFCRRLLEAAAYLHDTGHYVSDTRHHKHSYYLVANSDLPGFTLNEREIIANLCRYHRKALPTPEHENLQLLDAEDQRAVAWLIPLLRLADSLDRSHGQRIRSVECKQRDSDFLVTLNVPPETDIDLEIWAAERLTEIFRQVYNKPVAITRV